MKFSNAISLPLLLILATACANKVSSNSVQAPPVATNLPDAQKISPSGQGYQISSLIFNRTGGGARSFSVTPEGENFVLALRPQANERNFLPASLAITDATPKSLLARLKQVFFNVQIVQEKPASGSDLSGTFTSVSFTGSALATEVNRPEIVSDPTFFEDLETFAKDLRPRNRRRPTETPTNADTQANCQSVKEGVLAGTWREQEREQAVEVGHITVSRIKFVKRDSRGIETYTGTDDDQTDGIFLSPVKTTQVTYRFDTNTCIFGQKKAGHASFAQIVNPSELIESGDSLQEIRYSNCKDSNCHELSPVSEIHSPVSVMKRIADGT